MFEKQCARDYSPDGFLAIDEILYATRGSIGFKTYDKGKLIKYEIDLWSLESAKQAYIYYTISYSGKPEVITDTYIGDTLTLVKHILKELYKTAISWGVPIYIYGSILYLNPLS